MKNLIIVLSLLIATQSFAARSVSYDEAVARLKAKYALKADRDDLKAKQKAEREELKAKQKAEREELKAERASLKVSQ